MNHGPPPFLCSRGRDAAAFDPDCFAGLIARFSASTSWPHPCAALERHFLVYRGQSEPWHPRQRPGGSIRRLAEKRLGRRVLLCQRLRDRVGNRSHAHLALEWHRLVGPVGERSQQMDSRIDYQLSEKYQDQTLRASELNGLPAKPGPVSARSSGEMCRSPRWSSSGPSGERPLYA